MKFLEALKTIQSARVDAQPFRVALVCGYTPLHLKTFLAAHLQLALPEHRVVIASSTYGNVEGSIGNLAHETMDAICLTLEWEDLDPRLGFRSAGRWGVEAVKDILANVPSTLDRLAGALARIPDATPLVLAPPSIPLPPLFHTAGFQASSAELALQYHISKFQMHLATDARVAIVGSRLLTEEFGGLHYCLKSDLAAGLPYSLQYSDRLASLLAKNIAPPGPKKGIITDLDDTLWSGTVGELGPEGVTWDLAAHAHLHALYQKLVAALAMEGVLIAIASKNDLGLVEQALRREDCILKPELVFPLEVHWSAKSLSVSRILKTWNIAASSVVFVDDSPMELAEVSAAHPGIETVLFPKNDISQGLATLRRLRDLCGRRHLSEDDKIRRESIRQLAHFRKQQLVGAPESFLHELKSVLTLNFDCVDSSRAYSLVNKTNQFNLNGIRYTESEWRRLILRHDSFLVSASYEDRFGPLGVVAVLQGELSESRMVVNTWVLSCRAFGRRIEHAILRMLFDRLKIGEVEFKFIATARNGPLQEFLAGILGCLPEAPAILSREQFDRNCPRLYHGIRNVSGAAINKNRMEIC